MFLILMYFPKSSSSLWCGLIFRFLRVSPKLPCLFLKGTPIIFPVEIILIRSEVVCPVTCAQVLRHDGHKPKRCGPLSLPPPFPTRREQDTLTEPERSRAHLREAHLRCRRAAEEAARHTGSLGPHLRPGASEIVSSCLQVPSRCHNCQMSKLKPCRNQFVSVAGKATGA